MKKYLLSVDGGGTKTEFCISDIKGRILDSVTAECSNYKSVGMEKTYENLREGVRLLEQKGYGLSDVCFSVWGISGCDSHNDFNIIRGLVEKLGVAESDSYICNDGVLAFYAQASEPGIVVIAGTGSLVLGIDTNGDYQRAGGWGYNISDIGSGYWIGAEAVKRTLLYCDGYGEYTPFYERVREYFSCESFEQLPYIVTEVTDYFEIAKLARLVVEAGENNDETAICILSEGAEYLAVLVASTYGRLGFQEDREIRIVFSGGVLRCKFYQQLVKAEVGKRITLQHVQFLTQENAPSFGGIKLAERLWTQEGRRHE